MLSDACLLHVCVSACSLVFSRTLCPQRATSETLMSSGEMRRGKFAELP